MRDVKWDLLPFQRISVKLMFVFTLFIAVPLAINGLLIFSKTSNVMEKDIVAAAQNTLMFLDTNVGNLIRQYDAGLLEIYGRKQMFAELARVQGTPGFDRLNAEVTINDELSKFLYNHAFVESVYLLTQDNRAYYATQDGANDAELIADFSRPGGYRERISGMKGKGLWFPLTVRNIDGLYFARTIKNIYGDFNEVGTLLIRIHPDGLSRIFSDTRLPDGSFLSIYNDRGNRFVNRGELPANAETELTGSALGMEMRQAGMASVKLGGEEYMAFYRTSNYKGWQYAEYVPREQLTSQIFVIKQYFIFISLLSFLFLIIILVLVSQYITNPLRTLARAMGKLKSGNLDISVTVKSRDEVGLLGNSFNMMREQIKQLVQDVQVSGMKEKEAEIQVFKAQFNPHFLYNSLGAVNWKAIRAGQFEISDMLTDLSDILRYSLDKNGGDLVTVREDVRWLKKYVSLQKERFDYEFEAIFTVDPFAADCKIHKLLLQPLIENSIIHGFAQGTKDGLILVSIMESEGDIAFEVADNGVGMEEDRIKDILSGEGKGLGLRNVHERLRLHYGDGYGLTVQSGRGTGTKMSIRMPRIGTE